MAPVHIRMIKKALRVSCFVLLCVCCGVMWLAGTLPACNTFQLRGGGYLLYCRLEGSTTVLTLTPGDLDPRPIDVIRAERAAKARPRRRSAALVGSGAERPGHVSEDMDSPNEVVNQSQ